jgi:WD40 repeat protein
MFGRMLLSLVLGTVLCAGIAYVLGKFPAAAQDSPAARPAPAQGAPAQPAPAKAPAGDLYAHAQPVAPTAPVERIAEQPAVVIEPIVITGSTLAKILKQDVPSQREGVLLFVGIELKEGEQPPPDEKVWDVQIDREVKRFRRLKEGDQVEADQLLAVVDDTIARADLSIKEAKVAAAKADKTASVKTRDEAQKRLETQRKLWKDRATNMEDLRGAELTYDRYVYEAISKAEAITVAQQEFEQAKKILSQHQIKSKIAGVVKAIYKQPGEAVSAPGPGRNADPVLQIENYDKLRADGRIDEQYARALHKGDQVVIEPTRPERPLAIFKGHRGEINDVAVSRDSRFVVSASEDGMAGVWDVKERRLAKVLRHGRYPVRSVACTPPGAGANLALTGAGDGRARLWDLNATSESPLRELQKQYASPVSAVAFSPDGETCATASDAEGEIFVFKTATGEFLYPILGHRPGSRITALHFTPESELVSVSRDGTVRVWKLSKDGAQPVGDPILRRSTDVAQIGVSPDGKRVLDPQNKEMRILSLADGQTETVFQNTSQATNFLSMALFSPGGHLVLTSSSTEGVLQLWRIGKERSYELRLLNPVDRSQATCAAFAPDGSFVVGGTKDRKIYAWPMPSKQEVEEQLMATITDVEETVESANGQVRVVAEFNNPKSYRLFPGDVVSMVAYPQK